MRRWGFLSEYGFSLIEILLVISLLTIILAISVPNLFNLSSQANISSISLDIKSLLREAQSKAMNTDTQEQPTTFEFGIHFESNSYTLFKGSSYNSSDPDNFVVSTPNSIVLSSNLKCNSTPLDCANSVVFSRISGEVINFDLNNESYICISEPSTNKKIKLSLNSIGVVDVLEQNC